MHYYCQTLHYSMCTTRTAAVAHSGRRRFSVHPPKQRSVFARAAFLACVFFGLRAAFIRAFPVAGAGAGSNVYFALNGFANGWRSASEWVAVLQLQQPAPPRMLPH